MQIHSLYGDHRPPSTRAERIAVASGRAATRVGVAAKVLGRKGRWCLGPIVFVLTAIEQAAFGIDDLVRRR